MLFQTIASHHELLEAPLLMRSTKTEVILPTSLPALFSAFFAVIMVTDLVHHCHFHARANVMNANASELPLHVSQAAEAQSFGSSRPHTASSCCNLSIARGAKAT